MYVLILTMWINGSAIAYVPGFATAESCNAAGVAWKSKAGPNYAREFLCVKP